MKNLFALAGFTLLSMSISLSIFAQENDEGVYKVQESGKPPFILLYTEGAACSWLTRIIKQSGRSNFVFEDFLPGVYSRVDLDLSKNFTPMLRVAALYPLVSTFNNYPQASKTPLHYAVDVNLGIYLKLLEFAYFRLNSGPALHLFYLNSDRWNYLDLGMAVFVGMEAPITSRWTLVFNGFASLDNGNFGGNRHMEPFDVAYQYQIDFGVRYSKKKINRTSLFPLNRPSPDASVLSR